MAEVYALTDFDDVEAVRNKLTKQGFIREAEAWFLNCHVGLRGSDLLALKWSDLSEGSNTIIEGKTGKRREILITPVIEECINNLKAWYKKKHPDLNPTYIFQGTGNFAKRLVKPINVKHLNTRLKVAAKLCGVKDNIGSHTMRKTYGFHFYQACGDIHLLQKEFGHVNSGITLAYINVTRIEINKTKMALDFRKVA